MINNKRQLLSNLEKGAKGKIIDFEDEIIASRLMTMGILPNSSFELIRKAPLQSGFYIKSGQQRIALRQVEAESILVILDK